MVIEKWMTRHPHTVRPLDSIEHARQIMETHRVNQLPVVVEGHLVGIITDRDLRDAYPSVFDLAQGRDSRLSGAKPSAIMVETVMTPHVLTLSPTDSVAEAARLMRRERIGAVPILDGDRLVGIITRSDLLDVFVALEESTALPAALERGRAPVEPETHK